MSVKTLFLLFPFLLVVIIAVTMVFYKRKQTTNARRRPREPFVSKSKSTLQEAESYNDGIEDENAIQGNDIVDDTYEGIISKPRVIQQPQYKHDFQQAENKSNIISNSTVSVKPQTNSELDDLIILGLKSNAAHPYTGYELLQALLTVGLRFGKMNIFHRHEDASGRGEILFSLASAAEPGTFELNKMGAFSTPGLMLFMRLSQVKDPVIAFDLMCTTAQQLADDLGGEVLDNQRQLLTDEKIASIRNSIINSITRNQTADLFSDDA